MTEFERAVQPKKVIESNQVMYYTYDDGTRRTTYRLNKNDVADIADALAWAQKKEVELAGKISYFCFQKAWQMNPTDPEKYQLDMDIVYEDLTVTK